MKTTIYLSAEARSEIKALAKASGQSQAEVIRTAIDSYVAANRLPLPASIGLFEDEELGATEVAAWLKDNWRVE